MFLDIILNGGNESFDIESKTVGITRNYKIEFEGIVAFIKNQYTNAESSSIKRWAKGFMDEVSCTTCNGKRLKKNKYKKSMSAGRGRNCNALFI